MPHRFMSRHAMVRARQRGIGEERLEAFLALADLDAPVGGGCIALRISRRLKRDRRIREAFGPMLDLIADLALVMAGDGSIVTVMHDHGQASGRRYRRTH
ncbi:MAG: hypothetical protein IT548_16120 [Alphaproteobacteria bacterium]|nr:hypothetical protein [Alphaproteobacteria bacterium]